MLEIFIDKVSVDLPKEIQLAITIENPFMLEDRIPAPYSLNFEIPSTPKNLLLWDYPDRLGGYGENLNKWNKSCVIRFQGIDILTGHVTFLQYFDNIKLQFLGIDYNEYLKAPLNTLDLGRKYFSGSYANVNYRDPNNFAYQYASWAEDLASGYRGDMIAAPLVFVQENMPFSNFEEYSVTAPFSQIEYVYEKPKDPYKIQDKDFINQYNPFNGSFIIEALHDHDRHRSVYRSHANIFPAFRVGFLLDVIFGGLLLNNPFTSARLLNLVLPTYFFPTWKKRERTDVPNDTLAKNNFPPLVSNPRPSATSGYPGEPFLELKDFLPSTDSNLFVRSLLNLFCMTMYSQKGKLSIKSNDDILSALPKKNWTSKIIKGSDLKIQKGKQYIYGYRNAKKENINLSDAIEKTSLYEMMSDPYSLDENNYYEGKYKIHGQVFNKIVQKVQIKHPNGPVDENQFYYSLLDNGFNYNMDKGVKDTFEIISDIIPLPIFPATFYDDIDNDSFSHPDYSGRLEEWMVPGLVDVDRNSRPTDIHLCFFAGPTRVKGYTDKYYPGLNANYVSNTSSPDVLSWEGEYGLFEIYHKRFSNWIEKDKVALNVNLILNPLELKQLDILDKIHLMGRNFFISKMQYTIGLNSISPINIDFVEA